MRTECNIRTGNGTVAGPKGGTGTICNTSFSADVYHNIWLIHQRHRRCNDWTDHHRCHPQRAWLISTRKITPLHPHGPWVQFSGMGAHALIAKLHPVHLTHQGPPKDPHEPREHGQRHGRTGMNGPYNVGATPEVDVLDHRWKTHEQGKTCNGCPGTCLLYTSDAADE